MSNEPSFQKIGELLNRGKKAKAPAYPWQDLALKIIKDLNVPDFKKSAVFKVCRDLPEHGVVQCLIDTKELCRTGEKWKYFFKLTGEKNSGNSSSGEGDS